MPILFLFLFPPVFFSLLQFNYLTDLHATPLHSTPSRVRQYNTMLLFHYSRKPTGSYLGVEVTATI